jgi:hypothetical protein
MPISNKFIMNDSDRDRRAYEGQTGNSNESTAFQGVGFFGNNGNNNDAIMMIEGNDNACITRWENPTPHSSSNR